MCSARPRSARHSAGGFSLLEAVAATAFLAVALMAFAANTIWLTHDEKSADSTSAAHALAQQKLEQLRSMPLGATEVATGSYADPAKDRKSTRLNSSHTVISYAVFCLEKKKQAGLR